MSLKFVSPSQCYVHDCNMLMAIYSVQFTYVIHVKYRHLLKFAEVNGMLKTLNKLAAIYSSIIIR